jgi:LysR family hydrogen peroxide-inducible transcriptional activator
MELHQLRYFVATADAGSISRAAERCNLAQPSLSQQIRRLEDQLGRPLFDRIGRGVMLTEAGHALLPRARRILREVRDAEHQLQDDIDAGRGQLLVGAIPTMAPYVLPAALKSVRRLYPECDLTVREDFTERLVEAVCDHELDCAITSTPIDSGRHDRLTVEVLGREPLLVVVSSSHHLARDESISLPELRAEPTVTLHEMHCLGKQIDGFCQLRKVTRHIVCRTTQLATVLELVRLGLGISIVPAMAARADTSRTCRYLRLKRNEPFREIAMIMRSDRSRSAMMDCLANCVRKALRVSEASVSSVSSDT